MLALLFVLSLCACADEPGEGAAPASDASRPAASVAEDDDPGQPKSSGSPNERYDEAKAVCGRQPPKRVATDLGMETDNPLQIAKRYARGYVPELQRSVFAGCLAGLRGQKGSALALPPGR